MRRVEKEGEEGDQAPEPAAGKVEASGQSSLWPPRDPKRASSTKDLLLLNRIVAALKQSLERCFMPSSASLRYALK